MEDYKEICLTYYRRANKRIITLVSGLDELYYVNGLYDVWTSLEAYLNFRGYKKNRSKFAQDYNFLFERWKRTSLFNQSIKILIAESPVQNMDTKKDFYLTDDKDLRKILDFAFVPRGNLIHGDKGLLKRDKEGQRNRNLVEHSFKVIHEILEMFLLNEGWI